MLVAVLPDINSKMCGSGSLTNNSTSSTQLSQDSQAANTLETLENGSVYQLKSVICRNFDKLKFVACELNVLWLVWSVLQIFTVNLTFYGMKNIKWKLFIPHMMFRSVRKQNSLHVSAQSFVKIPQMKQIHALSRCKIIVCVLVACQCSYLKAKLLLLCLLLLLSLVIIFLIASFIYLRYKETHSTGIYFIVIASMTSFFILFWIYIMVCQLRCCQFVKRSAETGFSVSTTRPLGPPTISLSDARPAAIQANAPTVPAVRQLPPLRHTYHRRAPPAYGDAVAYGHFPVKTG
ncbi:unnamed protein product [Anisakis simplex]|uniref:MENTAL domain-containing protein n=1 Tax=Anisakis simplex TaxID=6269 RepID=A0A0M3K0D7_ANISI|nr:unnamed protein product [Anisakis simplex]